MVTTAVPIYRGGFANQTVSPTAIERMAIWPAAATGVQTYSPNSQASSVKMDKTATQGTVGFPRVRAQAHLGLLKQWYTVRKREDILALLAEQPQLLPILMDAPSEALRYFPGSQLSLEAVADPDTGMDPSLVVTIGTHLNPVEALQQLRMLDQNWWLDTLSRTDGKVCITVAFL